MKMGYFGRMYCESPGVLLFGEVLCWLGTRKRKSELVGGTNLAAP